MKFSIYVVDNHRMFAQGLKKILDSNEIPNVSRLFSSSLEVLEALKFERPDLVISDISMPGMSGIELAKSVKNSFPKMKFLILSMHNAQDYVRDALDAKVDGYVLKDAKPEEVLNAIRTIMSGGNYLSPAISAILMKTNSNKIVLTKREMEVLQEIALGLNTQQIADRLFVSTHTVETHRKNLLAKTGRSNSVDLSMWGIERGYIKIGRREV
jgi:DNA-binding NarL/FixJ family response regulator